MTEIYEAPQNPEDTSSILRTYGLFILGMILLVIPVDAMMVLGGVLIFIGFIGSFGLKKKMAGLPIGSTHAQWIKRSIWTSFLYFSIGTLIVFMILSTNADKTAPLALADAITNGTATPDQIVAMTEQYRTDNHRLIFWTYLCLYGPVAVLFMARMIKGYVLVEKDQPVKNPRSWLI